MAKGKRKRANKNEKNTKNNKVKSKIKKNKKSETKNKKSIYEMFPVRTLDQTDANRMKEIFTLSNNVAGLVKDYAEKEIQVKKMRKSAKELEKEKEPIMIAIAQNVFKMEKDYSGMAKKIRQQANDIEKSLSLVRGQIEHRYEDYVSSLIRQKRFIEGLLKKAELKSITGQSKTDPKTKKEEEILFEKEFDKLSDKDKKELKELEKKIKGAKTKKELDEISKKLDKKE
jgi:hypothetical protein